MFLWSAYAGVQFCAYEQLRATDFLNPRHNSNRNSNNSKDGYNNNDEDDVNDGGSGGRRISISSRREGERWGDADEVRGNGRGHRRRREQEAGVRDRGRGLPPAVSNFVYGSLAAFTATLLTYPLDITRTALAFQVRWGLGGEVGSVLWSGWR